DAQHSLPGQVRAAYASVGMQEETPGNRRARAILAADAMRSPFRQLLDTPEGAACWKYKAFPERLFIIVDGRVVHDAGQGIFGWARGWAIPAIHLMLDGLLAKRAAPRP